ncbi:endolytic transglycosylase MltG [Cryobacterium sp. TMT1-21]|uniref:endolytic transglycosylase MltG n=1 Tax=Cryobacterium sp. TMT2-10 TaxID=1259244 RepID=UPI00106B87D7|nr:endolytic transglycosylase MltG [Cryobacterium sp. TMT2-10]TFD16001.1 endolytic transglycosylase MltG [Cryobacterium sp. TMT1-21]TFD38272.1 endolytic transglycosylase MltG [Cryobacterium sp. TMT2-10]
MTNPPADPDRVPVEVTPSGWDALLSGCVNSSGGVNTSASAPRDPAVPGANASASPTVPSRRALRESQQPGTRSSRRTQLGTEPPRKKRRRGAWVGLIITLVVVALLAGGVLLLQEPLSKIVAAVQGPADYAGKGTSKVVVMIHDGETGQDVADSLVDQDVVKSYEAFYSLLLKESPAPVFQPGAYRLASKMSGRAALDALLDPASKLEQTVVIPEGTAAVDVLQLVSEGTSIPLADLKAAAKDVVAYGLPAEATSLEGFLFPATYTFAPELSAADAIKTLVDRQFQALDDAGVAPENRWKTIVLASLIQREAGLTEDYYKVSRVFLNRLDPAQWETGLLQSDATVAYGTGETHRVTTTDAERGDPANPYNTYQHPGLPIGPISNPGDAAIDAAVHPADGPWLYFVTWNLDTGETIFSATAAEHDAAVAKWLAWMDEHPEYG